MSTLATYTFIILQSTPKVAYRTLVDWYLLSCFIVLTAVIVQNVLFGWLSEEAIERGDEDQWFSTHELYQRACSWLFWVLWLAWNLFVWGGSHGVYLNGWKYVMEDEPGTVKKVADPDAEPKGSKIMRSRDGNIVRHDQSGELALDASKFGLKWKRLVDDPPGSIKRKLDEGKLVMLDNVGLLHELANKGVHYAPPSVLVFTTKEWTSFNVQNICREHVFQHCDHYYAPVDIHVGLLRSLIDFTWLFELMRGESSAAKPMAQQMSHEMM